MAYIVQQESGRWQIQIRSSKLNNISKTFNTKDECIQFEHEYLGDPQKRKTIGRIVDGEISVSALIIEFIEQYTGKDKSIKGRLKVWSEEFGHLPVSKLDKKEVRAGLIKFQKKGKKGKQLKPQTLNRFKANYSTAFEFGVEAGLIDDEIPNPTRGIKACKETGRRDRVFTPKEQEGFLEASKNATWSKFYLFCLMGFVSGARRGELQKLSFNDCRLSDCEADLIDTKNGTNRILQV